MSSYPRFFFQVPSVIIPILYAAGIPYHQPNLCKVDEPLFHLIAQCLGSQHFHVSTKFIYVIVVVVS